MRQVVDRGTGSVHCCLVNQMYLAKERRVAGGRAIEAGETAKKWHAGREMLLGQLSNRHRKFTGCIGALRDLLTSSRINIGNMGHLILLQTKLGSGLGSVPVATRQIGEPLVWTSVNRIMRVHVLCFGH